MKNDSTVLMDQLKKFLNGKKWVSYPCSSWCGLSVVEITIFSVLAGKFLFPEEFTLVNGVFEISTSCDILKPIRNPFPALSIFFSWYGKRLDIC